MKQFWKYGLAVLALALPLLASAQLRDSSRTTLHVGFLRNTVDSYSLGTISIEHRFHKWFSVAGTLGINPITRKGSIFPIWRLYWQVSAEVRYDLFLRRGLPMSGFFVGGFLSYDNNTYYYQRTMKPAIHEYFATIGPEIGYQHAFFQRMRSCIGIATVYYPRQTIRYFDSQGLQVGRTVWKGSYYFYPFLRVGLTF